MSRRDAAPAPTTVREFPLTGAESGPYGITAGPDGALWVTLVHSGEIARLGLDGEVALYGAGASDPSAGRPMVITPGPDGALWFTLNQANAIGRVTVTGEAESFAVPTPGSGPYGITPGPDGALWFTAMSTDRVGRITVDGEITEFPLPVEGGVPLRDHGRPGRRALVHAQPGERDRPCHRRR